MESTGMSFFGSETEVVKESSIDSSSVTADSLEKLDAFKAVEKDRIKEQPKVQLDTAVRNNEVAVKTKYKMKSRTPGTSTVVANQKTNKTLDSIDNILNDVDGKTNIIDFQKIVPPIPTAEVIPFGNEKEKVKEVEQEKEVVETAYEDPLDNLDATEEFEDELEVEEEEELEEEDLVEDLTELEEVEETSGIEDIKSEIKNAGRTLKGIVSELVNNVEYNRLENKFEKGRTVIGGDFEFQVYDRVVMVTKYYGNSSIIKFPSKVGGLPVCYISTDVFKGTVYKTSVLSGVFKNRLIQLKEYSGVEDDLSSIKVELPESLVVIPNGLFRGVKGLTKIVIPKNVIEIFNNTFNGSSIKSVYFNGKCPNKFDKILWENGIKVYVKETLKNTFIKK